MGKKYTVRCKSLDRLGRGIVTFNNSTFAVPYLLPGEKADISLVYGRGRENTTAELVEVLEPSENRVTPSCPHYRTCGGCNWMHMKYDFQLAQKQTIVREMIAEVSPYAKKRLDQIVLPILGMENPYNYRNKIHSTFGKDRRGHLITGLYKEHTHLLVPVSRCKIEHPIASRIMETIRRFAESRRILIYNENTGKGLLRHVLFRVAANGDVMVVPVIAENIFPEKKALVSAITKAHPEVKTIVLNYNLKKTTMVLGTREEVLFGSGVLEDTLGECVFRLSPRSFYQVNYEQTKKLYGEVLHFADLKPGETVIDAYCGIGTITMMLAKASPETNVIGVELNEEAVKDARSNAKRNGVENVTFAAADAGEYISKLAENGDTVDVLVMDPPRSGSSETFLQAARKLKPRKIVYVSCEPDTLARDLKTLLKDYKPEYIRPVDMFPQTSGIENVCLPSRIASL